MFTTEGSPERSSSLVDLNKPGVNSANHWMPVLLTVCRKFIVTAIISASVL